MPWAHLRSPDRCPHLALFGWCEHGNEQRGVHAGEFACSAEGCVLGPSQARLAHALANLLLLLLLRAVFIKGLSTFKGPALISGIS